MKIAIGADHRGFAHKEYIKKALPAIEWIDVGAHTDERSDYPAFARKVVECMQKGDAQQGVLICGSGMGIAMAANRYKKIYAGVVWDPTLAEIGKQHDNINVLVLPSDYVSQEVAVECIEKWRAAEFKDGRYQQRLDMID